MKVSLVTLGDPGQQTGGYLYHRRLAEAAARHDAELSFVSFPSLPFPLPMLWGGAVIKKAARADVIVIDSIATAFAAPWLGRSSKPVVGMLHQGPGGIDHGRVRTRVQARLDRFAYDRLGSLLVASESLRADLVHAHPSLRVVAPGRDVAEPAGERDLDLRRGRAAAFLCVGNWVRRKGVTELLDAFASLPEPAGTLHLVGDAEVDDRYAREVRTRLGLLGNRVVVHGILAKEEVADLYRHADVFVMPSTKEPYGTAYGEAMAFGLPVVGWRAGNLPYLARHEREGLVVEEGDVPALAEALHRLAYDEALRGRLGDAAYERAQTFPRWDDTAATFFSILRSEIG